MVERTASHLHTAHDVTDAQVDAAVDTYLSGIPTDSYVIAKGYVLNLRAAVEAHVWSAKILADLHATEAQKRDAVGTAILLAVTKTAKG